jgi:hypothetical protein
MGSVRVNATGSGTRRHCGTAGQAPQLTVALARVIGTIAMDWTLLRDHLTEAQASEVLAALGVEVLPSTLKKWRQRGTGPPWWRAVGSVYYSRDNLRAWIEEQQQEPTARPRRNGDHQ